MLFKALLFLILFFVKPALAQDTSPTPILFNQYQNDFIYQRDLYQKSLNIYNEKYQIDAKYSTVTTQNDKYIALKDTFKKRNQMLKSYLIALRIKLDSNKSINFDNTEKAQNNLKTIEQWLDNQNQNISNSSNLADLKNWSVDFKNKYAEIQRAIYTALTQNEINLNLQTFSDINNLTARIQSQPEITDEDKKLIDEIKNNSTKVTDSLNNAYNLSQKPNVIPNKFNDFYPKVKMDLPRR